MEENILNTSTSSATATTTTTAVNNENLIYDVMKYDTELRGFAMKMTQNVTDTEDLMQDTYLKVAQYSSKYTQDTNLKAWVVTIMKNTFINSYRRRQHCKIVSDDYLPAGYENCVTDPSDAADLRYYITEISNSIAAKEESQRKPFEMYLDGYKYQEIADIMQLPIGTVKSRIHFTRKKLMEELQDYVSPTFPRTA